VHGGFASIAVSEPERLVRIDASQSIEAVHQAIIDALNIRLKLGLKEVEHA